MGKVPLHPPYGVDLPANLRFLRLGLAADVLSGESRYLDWCRDYADEWVRDMRANNWVAPSEITMPTHEPGGFGSQWYRLRLRPDWSWEGSGLAHTADVGALLDLAVAAGEPGYATAVARQLEVMWNASDGPAPLTFFGSKGWSRIGSEGQDPAGNERLVALQLLALRRVHGVRAFDDRILRWAASLSGERPVDALVHLLAYEVSRDDKWLVRSLDGAVKTLRGGRGGDETGAGIAAQVAIAATLGGPGFGGGAFPWMEMLFADGEARLGLPPEVAAATVREGSSVRCLFYNVGSASQAVTLVPPCGDQRFGRVRTMRAKVLGWPGRGVTVRVLPGYHTAVIAELEPTRDARAWDPPAGTLTREATPSLRVFTDPGEVEEAREEIWNRLVGRARELDREHVRRWESLRDDRERESYRVAVRSRLLQSLGGFPARNPLNARKTGLIEKSGYRVENWLIESRPRFFVPVNLYVPAEVRGRVPGVLVFCGDSPEGKSAPETQAVGIDLVRRGYVVLVHDPVGRGERGKDGDPASGNDHFYVGNQCYLLGKNLAQFFVWDAMRALDFLVSRPEVDPDRIGCTGSGEGGAVAQLVTALDARVRVAVPVGYACDTVSRMAESGPEGTREQSGIVLVGELEKGVDQFGRSLLISPRPMLLCASAKDSVLIEGARLLHERLLAAYQAAGATEALSLFEDPGGHGYSRAQREATVAFFNRWLMQKQGAIRSSAADADYASAEALECAPGGQVANLRSETVHSLLAWEAEGISPSGPALKQVEEVAEYQTRVREGIFSLLDLPEAGALGTAEDRGALRLEDAVVRKVLLRSAEGIPIPGVLAFREDAVESAPVVVCLGDRGKLGTEGEDASVLLALVRSGFYVFAVDPRGMGETRPDALAHTDSGDSRAGSSLASASLRIGDPLFGQRVRDVREAVNLVCSGTGECARRVGVYGQGQGALLAIVAAAADSRVAVVAAAGPVYAYRAFLEQPEFVLDPALIIPGILGRLDVADLVAAVAPRPLLIVNPLTGQAGLVDEGRFLEAYRGSRDAFELTGGALGHRFLRPEEVPDEVAAWFRTNLSTH